MKSKIQMILQKIARFKLTLLLVAAIVIALLLTVMSVALYVKSGVASLDLSRPGYEQAREQIRPTADNERFDPNGPIDKKSLEEFRELYQAEFEQLTKGSDFSEGSLDDSQLRLDTN